MQCILFPWFTADLCNDMEKRWFIDNRSLKFSFIVSNCWMLPVEDMRLCPCILNTGHCLQQNCLHIVLKLLVLCHSAGGSSISGWWSVPVSSPAACLAHACMHLPHTGVAVYSVFYSNLKLCFVSPQQELQLLLQYLDVSSIIFPLSTWLHTFCGLYKAVIFLPFIDYNSECNSIWLPEK